jgi:hypothetical protein
VNQICNLERKVGRGGRDSIDHARGAKDDLANVAAGVFTMLTGRKETGPFLLGFLDPVSMEIEATTPATEPETTGPRQPKRIRQEGK